MIYYIININDVSSFVILRKVIQTNKFKTNLLKLINFFMILKNIYNINFINNNYMIVEPLNFSTGTIYFGLVIASYNCNIIKQVATAAKNVNKFRNYCLFSTIII